MDRFPILDRKLFQAGTFLEIERIFETEKPSIVIDCSRGLPPVGLKADKMFLRVPFDDQTLPRGEVGFSLLRRLHATAIMMATLIRDGEAILTHCDANENRSSLVNGLILLELRKMGLLTFKRVTDYILNKRPHTLSNSSFVGYLNRLSDR